MKWESEAIKAVTHVTSHRLYVKQIQHSSLWTRELTLTTRQYSNVLTREITLTSRQYSDVLTRGITLLPKPKT